MPRCVQFLTSLKLPFEKDSQPFNPRQMGREYTVYTVYTLYSHCTKQRLCGTVLRGGMLERVRISKRKRQMSSELFGTYHSTILYYSMRGPCTIQRAHVFNPLNSGKLQKHAGLEQTKITDMKGI